MRIGIYCRVSTKNQEDNSSLDSQRELGIEFCKKKGFEYELYSDTVSGTKVIRKDLEKLVDKLYRKKLDGFWLYNWDRLSREKRVMIYFEDIVLETKCKIYVDNIERDIINNEGDRMDYEFRGLMSNLERMNIKRRMSLGLKQKLRNNDVFLGVVPIGYKKILKKIVTDEVESLLIKDCFSIFLHKDVKNYRDCIRKLQLKYKGNLDERISEKSLSRILNDSKYKGIYVLNYQDEIYNLKIGRIISDELFEEVIKKIEYCKGLRRGSSKRDYLLKGIVRCGGCKNTMWIRGSKNYRYYYCKEKQKVERRNFDDRFKESYQGDCNKVNRIQSGKLERLVWDLLFNILSRTGSIKNSFIKKYDKGIEDKNSFRGKLNYYGSVLKKIKEKKLIILDKFIEGKISEDEKGLLIKKNDNDTLECESKIFDIELEFRKLELKDDVLDYLERFKIDLNKKYELKRFEDKRRFIEKYVKYIEVEFLTYNNIEHRKIYNIKMVLNILDLELLDEVILERNLNLDGNEYKFYISNLNGVEIW